MFAKLITQTRKNVEKRRKSLLIKLGLGKRTLEFSPRDQVPSQLLPHYEQLLAGGTVVWGAMVQVNNRLLEPGQDDLHGNTAFSPSPYFDDNPQHLREIAARVFALKGTTPDDAAHAKIAAIISDEFNQVTRVRLPATLSDGHEVYLATTLFHRSRLPNGLLEDPVFPLMINPPATEANMIVPSQYWSAALIESTGRLRDLLHEHARPNRVLDADAAAEDAIPWDEPEAGAVVTVTHAAAEQIRQSVRSSGHEGAFFLRVDEKDGDYSADIVSDYDELSDTCAESCGIHVVFAKEDADRLAGTVLGFRNSIYGAGFVFNKRK